MKQTVMNGVVWDSVGITQRILVFAHSTLSMEVKSRMEVIL